MQLHYLTLHLFMNLMRNMLMRFNFIKNHMRYVKESIINNLSFIIAHMDWLNAIMN